MKELFYLTPYSLESFSSFNKNSKLRTPNLRPIFSHTKRLGVRNDAINCEGRHVYVVDRKLIGNIRIRE